MRKIVGILGSVLLALIGAVLLASYVQGARDEIREEEQLVSVYVVAEEVPAGAAITDVLENAALQEVPVRLVAVGAVDDPADIAAGLVTDAVLHPGEQVVAARFVEPFEAATADVPAGRQEMTLKLEPERAVGGLVRPGSQVAIIVSLDRDEPAAPAEGETPTESTTAPRGGDMTQMVLQHVLVTNLQYTSPEDAAAAALVDAAVADDLVGFTPTAPVLVTLALTTDEVEQIVYAAEFGSIWLTLEGPDVDDADGRIIAGLDVFALSGGDG